MILAVALAAVRAGGWFGKVEKDGRNGTSNVGPVGGANGRPAGDATNVVTDYVQVRGESRSHDAKFVQEITAAYKAAFTEAAAGRDQQRGQGRPREVHDAPRLHPFRLKETAPVVTRAVAAVRRRAARRTCASTNGGLDANWMVRHGIPTVTFGAGQNEIHTVDEWVDLAEFEAGCRLAYELATIVVRCRKLLRPPSHCAKKCDAGARGRTSPCSIGVWHRPAWRPQSGCARSVALRPRKRSDPSIGCRDRVLAVGQGTPETQRRSEPTSTSTRTASSQPWRGCGFRPWLPRTARATGQCTGAEAGVAAASQSGCVQGARRCAQAGGDDAEVVREVQQKLSDLNYRIAKIDGVMSDETRVAIRRLQAALNSEPYQQAHGRPACRSQACQGSDGVGGAGLGQTAELGRVPAPGPRNRRAGRQGPVQEEDGQGLPGHHGRDERLRCLCRIGRPHRKYPPQCNGRRSRRRSRKSPQSPRSLNAEGSRRPRICAKSGRKSAQMVATSRSRQASRRCGRPGAAHASGRTFLFGQYLAPGLHHDQSGSILKDKIRHSNVPWRMERQDEPAIGSSLLLAMTWRTGCAPLSATLSPLIALVGRRRSAHWRATRYSPNSAVVD